MSKLLIDNDCGLYEYCEQCHNDAFHLRILNDEYQVVYICEDCYLKEVQERSD